MSYPDLTVPGPKPQIDLLTRKEFYALKNDPARNFRDPPGARPEDEYTKYLKIHSHQLFVRNFINPDTPYRCLHLMHATGTGKTLAAVACAMEFIRVYKRLYALGTATVASSRRGFVDLDRQTPSIWVFGFNAKSAFIRELLRYPEFGFISAVEKEELIKRQRFAAAGLPDDIKHLKEYYTHLKKRITNKSRGGFFKFFGYDEFVNRLFIAAETDLKLVDLETAAAGGDESLEDIFRRYIDEGRIQVNASLVKMFDNSLLICDEVHNTYNMNMKNNRGVAIQYLLDTVPSLRFLSLSATPINNSPTEVVELMNYLLPAKITKREFFTNPRTMLPGKMEELGRLSRGRISFLQDVNIKYFPRREFVGEELHLPIPVEGLTVVPYLKFTPCPMSQFHQATYEHLRAESGDSTRVVPTDGYTIFDIAFPSPASDEYGMYKSGEVRGAIMQASQEWRDKYKIMLKKFSTLNNIITGEFLARENVGRYSTKCATLLDILAALLAGDMRPGKIMIYHDRVKMSGVLLIQELLRTNNYLDEHGLPTDATKCAICGRAMSAHIGGDITHAFRPARFVIAHSDIDKSTRDESLAKFNAADNAMGDNFLILIGSKIIKESYDFKDIQHLIVMSLPVNIPTLIQVFGRSVRKDSHVGLPPEMRKVEIRILISTAGEGAADPISPEVNRYVEKLLDYQTIQRIEREFNRNAIDADLHRDIIMPPDMLKKYFPKGQAEPQPLLGNLYFEPAVVLPRYELSQLNLITFSAREYGPEEVKLITIIIKRLFIDRPVWTYDDLWDKVRAPPFGIEVNPQLFLEYNFIIALNGLVAATNTIISAKQAITSTFITDRIFDYQDRFIYRGGMRYKIEQVDRYYILFPVSDIPENPLNIVYSEFIEHARDKERAMIKELREPNDHVLVDAETYLRPRQVSAGVRININKYNAQIRAGVNYIAARDQFIRADPPDIFVFLSLAEQFQMQFAADAIVAAVGGGTMPRATTRVLEMLDKFGAIVRLGEIRKYKDIVKQFKGGLPADLPADTPMGYLITKSVRLYDSVNAAWIEVSRIALNRQITYKENEIIIGYMEAAEDDRMKFKLRKPIQYIRAEADTRYKQSKSEMEGTTARTAMRDTRLVERGIVCNTKSKKELLRIMANLGISVARLGRGEMRIKRLCELIKRQLIESEMKERGKNSRYKYLYSWWDEQPALV